MQHCKFRYEFWNEQNGCGWVNPGCRNSNTAADYAPWLCRWYKAMKSVDSGLQLSVVWTTTRA